MKVIAYAIFGYGRSTPENCYEFESYIRGLFINVRINRILYPDFTNIVNIDAESYHSKYKNLFDWLTENTHTKVVIQPSNEPLCKAMLWRFKTVFSYEHPTWTYSHILCRDTDSISTFREAQAVHEWIKEDRAAHCITDSISHNIPMMGGMCGFRPGYVNDRLKVCDDPGLVYETLLDKSPVHDFNRKGSDQDFLMKMIYPKVANDSCTCHFILGMRQVTPEGNGMHYSIPDIDIGVDRAHKFLDSCAGHIGASGHYDSPMIKWLNTIDPFRMGYKDIQKAFPRLFFWQP